MPVLENRQLRRSRGPRRSRRPRRSRPGDVLWWMEYEDFGRQDFLWTAWICGYGDISQWLRSLEAEGGLMTDSDSVRRLARVEEKPLSGAFNGIQAVKY